MSVSLLPPVLTVFRRVGALDVTQTSGPCGLTPIFSFSPITGDAYSTPHEVVEMGGRG